MLLKKKNVFSFFFKSFLKKKKKHSFFLKNFIIFMKKNKDKDGIYTTKEFKTPTAKTRITHKPKPEKTVPLFPVQPSGEAKTTGTPTTKKKDTIIKARRVS